jgi:hypothetical protein
MAVGRGDDHSLRRLGQPGNDPSLVAESQSSLAWFLPVLDQQLAGREYILGRPRASFQRGGLVGAHAFETVLEGRLTGCLPSSLRWISQGMTGA